MLTAAVMFCVPSIFRNLLNSTHPLKFSVDTFIHQSHTFRHCPLRKSTVGKKVYEDKLEKNLLTNSREMSCLIQFSMYAVDACVHSN